MLMKKNIAETVRSLVEKPLGDAGFSLWNVRYEKEGKDFVLLVEGRYGCLLGCQRYRRADY